MARFLVVSAAGISLFAAILHLMGKRRLSCWLLVPLPAIGCGMAILELSHGAQRIGESSFETDLMQLAYLSVLLVLSLIAALRSNWRWLFRVAWMSNATVCAVFVYLAFFWKVFSQRS